MTAWRYIALGFRTDCFKLLSAFQASACHSFKRFTEIWREMKFSYIYYERKSFCELLEFTEEVFMVCKEFLYPPNSLPFQIGSIYLMYGLYLKQPTRNQVKIRFTLYEWNLLNKVWNITLSVNDLNVPLIISRLYLMNAFQFCFTERQMGLEKKFRKYYEGGEKSTGEMLPMTVTPVMEKLDIQALEDVCGIFYQYEEARNNLSSMLFHYADVKLKKHFDADIISNLKTSALERIERESVEINRYCELNGPTDSEDSNEEINEDPETGVPWWQCKKKMPWWKRCLPFGKQNGKYKKRRKENSVEDFSELSLEEDIDNPDIIYFSERESLNSEGNNSTESRNIIIDGSSLPSEGNVSIADASHLSLPWNTRKRKKGKKQRITKNIITSKSALPSEGNMSFSIPSCSPSPVSKRKGIKRKVSTIAKGIMTDNSSVSSEDNISVANASILSTPGKKSRKISKGSNPFATKRSYKTKKSTKITVTIDNSSVVSECDKSIAITNYCSSPVRKRKSNKRKKTTNTMNVATHIPSASSEGKMDITMPNHTTSTGMRRQTSKVKSTFAIRRTNRENKSPTIRVVSTDNSSVSLSGDKHIAISTHLTSFANKRKAIRRKMSTTTKGVMTDNLSSRNNMSITITSAVSNPGRKRKTSKGSNSFAMKRSYKGNKSTKITVTTDNSSIASECDKSIAITTLCLSPMRKRKTDTQKKSTERKSIATDISSVPLEGKKSVTVATYTSSSGKKRKTSKGQSTFAMRRNCKENKSSTVRTFTKDNSSVPLVDDKYIAVSTHLTSSGNKRKLNKGKKSAKTKKILTDAMTYTSTGGKESVAVPNLLLSPANKRKSSKRKKSSETGIGNAINSSVCSEGNNSIAVSTHHSSRLRIRR